MADHPSKKKPLENEEGCSPASITTLPLDTENPFQKPFCDSDVVLVVEGQKLHVHKVILSMQSPVFHRMFHGDFIESRAKEIEIKDTSHVAMIAFLREMYPAYDAIPIKSDKDLADILPLADFYQANLICRKCEDYIGLQLKSLDNQGKVCSSEAGKIMLYLQLKEKFHLEKCYTILLQVASKLSLDETKEKSKFNSLELATQRDLLKLRCHTLQKGLSGFARLMNRYSWSRGKCKECDEELKAKSGICRECVDKGTSEHLKFNF